MPVLLRQRGIVAQPAAAVLLPTSGLIGRLRGDSIVQADGSAVATWPGLVGGDAVQPTAGNRPTYVASAVSGKPAVQFTPASAQYMDWAGVSASVLPLTVLAVFRPPTTWPVPATTYHLLGSAGTGGLALYFSYAGHLGIDKLEINTYYTTVIGVLTAGAFVAVLVAFDTATGTRYWYRNGTLLSASTNNPAPAFTAAQASVVGRDPFWAEAYMDGRIAELAKWDHVLDATERSQVFAYTLARYGF